jgi:hypothetical protein
LAGGRADHWAWQTIPCGDEDSKLIVAIHKGSEAQILSASN